MLEIGVHPWLKNFLCFFAFSAAKNWFPPDDPALFPLFPYVEDLRFLCILLFKI